MHHFHLHLGVFSVISLFVCFLILGMEACSNLISWVALQLSQWTQNLIDSFSWMKAKESFLDTLNPCSIFWVNRISLLFMALLTRTWEVHCYHLLAPQSSETKSSPKSTSSWDPIFLIGIIKSSTFKKRPKRFAIAITISFDFTLQLLVSFIFSINLFKFWLHRWRFYHHSDKFLELNLPYYRKNSCVNSSTLLSGLFRFRLTSQTQTIIADYRSVKLKVIQICRF